MKKCLLVSIVVLAVLAVTAGLLGSQLGRVQSKHNVQIAGDGTGPIPTCRPGTNCNPDDELRQIAGDGTGPIPTCRPGTNCNPDDELRQIAGDGTGPIPTCRPGTNCKPDDDLRQIAGDGTGPIPTCRPGTNCKPDDDLRQIAAQAGDVRVQLEGLFGSNERFLAELS